MFWSTNTSMIQIKCNQVSYIVRNIRRRKSLKQKIPLLVKYSFEDIVEQSSQTIM